MKKATLFIAALAIVLLPISNASAFTLGTNGYEGPIKFKFTDFSDGRLYQSSSDNDSDGNLDGQADYGNADGVEDAWGIFKITSILSDDQNATTLWFDGKDGQELTGIYRDLDDDFYSVGPGGVVIESVGGIIELYLDSTPDFNANPGPGARVGDTYPTVTDGTLFLRLAFVPGIKYGNADPTDDHIVYQNNLDSTTAPFTGEGAFYLDVIGGEFASLFNSNRWKVTDDNGNVYFRDFFGQFDTTTQGSGPWLVKSEDPISGAVGAPIPEPATMVLLGSGLLGMAGVRRRKA